MREPYSNPPTFRRRVMANHLLFLSMGFVVLAWSWLIRAPAALSAFSKADFEILIRFIDAKQVAIPIAAAFFLYFVVTLIAHQANDYRAESRAHDFRELLHGELSSILLSSSSLALAVGLLLVWVGSFGDGMQTLVWWPVGLALSYWLRPRSQDGHANYQSL